ncbi:MAG: NusG domain II-containing protein [Ignavibacteria bacterium]|nr:NusG domain II-containing protein [Ignavibacteria bacterium]
MDRRDFLKTSSMFIAAGMVLPSAVKSMLSKPAAKSADSFSLEVITDNPDKASSLIQQFAKNGFQGYNDLKYSEFPVSGSVMGDLVYVQNGQLCDYTKSYDDESLLLKEIRSKLSLPSVLSNPVRIRLYRNNGSDLRKVFVARKGQIIQTLDPFTADSVTLHGKSGKLILNVNNGIINVSDSDCKHKICKQMSSIRKNGDYITCIPNELQIFAE